MFSSFFLCYFYLTSSSSSLKQKALKDTIGKKQEPSHQRKITFMFSTLSETPTSSKSQPNDSERLNFQRHATLKNKTRRSPDINRCLYRNADFSICKGTTFFCNSKKTKEKITFLQTFSTIQR